MSKTRALSSLADHNRRLAKLGQACELLAPGRFDHERWRITKPALVELEEAVAFVQLVGVADFPTWAGAVDGWPADNFFAVLWHYTRPSQHETIDRMLQAANGDPTSYRMRHAFTPSWFEPAWDPTGKGGDCSGFVAYGLDRDKNGGDDWQNAAGQDLWLHTGSLYSDALRAQRFFRYLEHPEPGCLFAYPDRPKSEGGGQGHTGLILSVDATGTPKDGVDCSYGQGKRGDAIRVRDMSWTVRAYARCRKLIFLKPIWWE